MNTMQSISNEKVVISGLGVVSTLGSDVDSFWQNLNQAMPGYSGQASLHEKGTPFTIAGCIEDTTIAEAWPEFDRTTQLSLSAASQALKQAGLDVIAPGDDAPTVGVVVGTTCGANGQIESEGFEDAWFSGHPEQCSTDALERYDHSKIANAISKTFGFDGPSYVVGTACASGNHAVGEAFNMIKNGQADIVLCGGADAFTLLPVFGFYSMKSLADEKCSPFDKDRDGMILGEAGAILVLESESSAKRRGVVATAQVKSWSLNCDAVKFAAPLESGERFEELVQQCLHSAQLEASEIDYINAHGTATQTNDVMEARGVARVLANETQSHLPISSIKGQLGHTLGASGALDALVCTLAIQHGLIPANTPVGSLDDEVNIDLVTEPRTTELKNVLSVSFAFGGCNVATLFSHV